MSFSNNHEFVVSKLDKVIGMILVVGLVVVFFTYISYEKQNIRDQWLTLTAYTNDSYNLTEGAVILLSGVNIGKIQKIDLAKDGRVMFTLLLDKHFDSFYVNDSNLSIDSDLNINSIFGGSSLLFNRGGSNISLIENDTIDIIEPQSVTKIIEQLDMQELVSKLSIIINNLVDVTSALKDKEDNFDTAISNISNAANAIDQASDSFSVLLDSSRQMIDDIRLSLAQVQPEATTSLRSVNQTMTKTQELLVKLNTLIEPLITASHDAPETIESTNLALSEIRMLAHQLNNHWLINQRQSNEGAQKRQSTPAVLPQDLSLYQTDGTIVDKE